MRAPYFQTGHVTLYLGDVRDVLAELPEASFDCVVTSPPYWGLRDYGVAGQIGLEATPSAFLDAMTDVFGHVRRVLAPHGTLWLNLGDSYASDGKWGGSGDGGLDGRVAIRGRATFPRAKRVTGLKPKDLVGIPWRVAFALQEDGWYLRSDIVWAKPNPMPESVDDRPTKSHEYVFLMTKNARYYYDPDAIREPQAEDTARRYGSPLMDNDKEQAGMGRPGAGKNTGGIKQYNPLGRNSRSVWTIATHGYPDAHFATFPEELPRRAISAGCPERVCVECGVPSSRLTSVSYRNDNTTSGRPSPTNSTRPRTASHEPNEPAQYPVRTRKLVDTIGWTDCGHGAYRRGVVLDPFAGSGTTLAIARDMGRDAVGIELNEEYAQLIVKRTQQEALAL